MLISYEPIPMFVEKTEMPSDESNNQFFVWEFPELNVQRDAGFQNKLIARLGHYIRTELRAVFESINKNYTRYGIPVPITKYENQLFENNTTNIEAQADLILEKIDNRFNQHNPDEAEYKFYGEGYLCVSLIEEYTKGGIHYNTIIKNLKKRKKIEQLPERKKENKRKYTCYKIL
jgi:hypothetical protein